MKSPTKSFLIFVMGLLLSADNLIFAQEPPKAPPQSTGNETIAREKTAGAKIPPEPLEPVMQIKRLETEEPLYSFELREVEIGDLFRVMAHDYKLNLLVDNDVGGRVSASLTNVSLEEALNSIAEAQNLKLEKKGNIIRIGPHLITRAFTLKYIEAKELLGTSTVLKAEGAAQTSTIYDLLSKKGRILLGRQPNSIVVIDYPANIAKVEDYLKELDKKMASRVFKLKYLKAADVVGSPSASGGQTAAGSTPAATSASQTAVSTPGNH